MSESLPPNFQKCTQCGAELPAGGTNGLCPSCLMAEAMKPSGPKTRWEPPSAEELAKLLPQYDITRILGRGGMGAVYQGTQKSLDRPVAIKILSAQLEDSDQGFKDRFKNEARAMAKLSHPGIVAVYDSGETADGLLYIVMEFIEGTDVARMIAKQKRLHTEHAMAITAHVCDALAYAHERGIIHRDIKPANIMVGYDGVVKVADFGLAKMSKSGESGLTQSGMAMGTLHYMAPESLTLGTAVDQRADIYAVGVMLYQMLTGKLPQGLFELPSLQVPGLDPRYDGIIGKALREDRELRYPSTLDMRHDLDAILTQPVVKVEAAAEKAPAALETLARPQRPAGQPYRPPQRGASTPPPKKKSSTGLIIAGLAVLVLIAAWVFLKNQTGTRGVEQAEDLFSPLTAGLVEIGANFQQSGLLATDPAWRGIVGGRDEAEGPGAIVLARQFDQGRIVAVTENAFWEAGLNEQHITLANNIMNWLSAGRNRRMAILPGTDSYAKLLPHWQALGFAKPDRIAPGFTSAQLADYGLVIAPNLWEARAPADHAAVIEYVRNGGGLFMTGLAWSYAKPLGTYGPNVLGAEFGVIWLRLGVRDQTQNYGSPLAPRYRTFYPDVKLAGLDDILQTVRIYREGDYANSISGKADSPGKRLYPRALRLLDEITAALKPTHPILDRITVFNASRGTSAAAVTEPPVPQLGPKPQRSPEVEKALALITRLGGKYDEEASTSGHPIVGVNLHDSKITNEELLQLKPLTALRSLNLFACVVIGDAGLAAVDGMTDLKTLDLWSCYKITDAGLEHFKNLTKLETLILSHSGGWAITGSGLVHLQKLASLKKLSLNHLPLLEDKALASLSQLISLKDLGLMYCKKVTDDGLDHLQPLDNLTALDLRGTQVSDAGLQKLKPLKRLQMLDIRETKVTDAGVACMQAALPSLQMIR